jgi:hypothetical protein
MKYQKETPLYNYYALRERERERERERDKKPDDHETSAGSNAVFSPRMRDFQKSNN